MCAAPAHPGGQSRAAGGRSHVAELDHRRLLVIQERVVQLQVPARRRRVRHGRVRATPLGQRAGCARMALWPQCANLTLTPVHCLGAVQEGLPERLTVLRWPRWAQRPAPPSATCTSRVVECKGATQAGAPVRDGMLVAVRNGVDELLRSAAAQLSVVAGPRCRQGRAHMLACCATEAADACAGSEHTHASIASYLAMRHQQQNVIRPAGYGRLENSKGFTQTWAACLHRQERLFTTKGQAGRTSLKSSCRRTCRKQAGPRGLQCAWLVGLETLDRQADAASRAARRTRNR